MLNEMPPLFLGVLVGKPEADVKRLLVVGMLVCQERDKRIRRRLWYQKRSREPDYKVKESLRRKVKICECCKQEFLTLKTRQRFCDRKCAAPETATKNTIPIEKRLWTRLKISDNGCWNWTLGKTPFGYGRLKWNSEVVAHRIAWILSFGEIPDGLCVLHRCDNPSCCNPLHLFLGTYQDNVDDMINKGRQRFGINGYNYLKFS